MKRSLYLLAALAVLSGCTGTSQEGLDKTQQMLSRSAALRQDANTVCIEEVALQAKARRENMAKVMSVPLARVPVTFCRRVLGAMASGRLKQADFEAAVQGQGTPTVMRILKGRG